MAYLTRWRLQLAARSLEKTSRGVAEIAGDVGYESEAAFNRAFKREFGRPPGQYRSDQKAHLAMRPTNGRRKDESVSSMKREVAILTTGKQGVRRTVRGNELRLPALLRQQPASVNQGCAVSRPALTFRKLCRDLPMSWIEQRGNLTSLSPSPLTGKPISLIRA